MPTGGKGAPGALEGIYENARKAHDLKTTQVTKGSMWDVLERSPPTMQMSRADFERCWTAAVTVARTATVSPAQFLEQANKMGI